MVELKKVSYSVKDEATGRKQDILKDVSLRFEDASITVITGPNGSGKSTLIKLLMGLEKTYFGANFVQRGRRDAALRYGAGKARVHDRLSAAGALQKASP